MTIRMVEGYGRRSIRGSGKVLAGEVKRPGSYSLRALDLLKNMTQQEAEMFVRVGKVSFPCDTEGATGSSADALNGRGGDDRAGQPGVAFCRILKIGIGLDQ